MNYQIEDPIEKKSKKKKWLLLLLLLLLIVVGGGVLGLWMNGYFDKTPKTRLTRDEAALAGQLDGKTPLEIADILGEKVAEGMVSIGVAESPIFEYNGKKGRLGIENSADNRYSFMVDLVLDETGETLYQSNIIDPGYYIEYVELNKTLPEGNYPATVIFYTYSLDETEDQIGEAHASITLNVIDGQYYTE